MAYTSVQKIPLKGGRWNPSAIPKIQGGLFTVTGKPLTWEDGRKILEQYLRPEVSAGYEQALLAIGEQIKRILSDSLRAGGTTSVRPLTPYTLAARAKRGNRSDAFLNDTGSLIDDLEVVLATPASRGRQGYSGVILRDKGDRWSSHSGGLSSPDGLGGGAGGGNDIGMWRLLNILCQTGLVLYADDLTPEGLRRIMAFRDRFFKGAEGFTGKSADDALARGPITDEEYFTKYGGLTQRDGVWYDGTRQATKQTLEAAREGAARARSDAPSIVGEAAVWDRVEQSRDRWRRLRGAGVGRDEGGKGPVVFIPPRPFMNEATRKRIDQEASLIAQKYFSKAAEVTSAALRAERWEPERHQADLRAIVIQ